MSITEERTVLLLSPSQMDRLYAAGLPKDHTRPAEWLVRQVERLADAARHADRKAKLCYEAGEASERDDVRCSMSGKSRAYREMHFICSDDG